jgi:hypothetical protein
MAPPLKQPHRVPAQDGERPPLIRPEAARPAVDHAQRAERLAARRHQRRAGVEADVGLGDEQGIVGEARIGSGVRHDEQTALEDGVPAERHRARRLGEICADARLEPLAMLVDERQQRDRRLADERRQRRQIVERLLGRGIEDVVTAERLEAARLVGRGAGWFHSGSTPVSSGRRPLNGQAGAPGRARQVRVARRLSLSVGRASRPR